MEERSFICAACGRAHSEIGDIGFEAPDQWLAVPEAERVARGHLTSDTCEIDGQHFFVRGCLEVPVHGQQSTFMWGVWVTLSESHFRRYDELYEVTFVPDEGPYFGWLCNRIRGYPDTLQLKANVHLRPYPTRPAVELEPTAHPLSVHQRQGIDRTELNSIVREVLHGSHAG